MNSKKLEEAVRVVLRIVRKYIYATIDFLLPTITYRNYLGYKLFYSKGTGLVDRLRFLSPQKIYEPELCQKVTEILNTQTDPVFFDIGANIGLISLCVSKHAPQAKIMAFEPGPHQHALLELTVASDASLQKMVQLFPYAISDKTGPKTFHVNTQSKDSSGDGFIDTKRSGNATIAIAIEAKRLDDFVREQNIERIDVIKIDIEGAELYALHGAIETIKKYRPSIFFELQPLNLRAYPYEATDVLEFFHEHDYTVFDLEGTVCDRNNLNALIMKDDMLVAKPRP